jgi:hypothetical protein
VRYACPETSSGAIGANECGVIDIHAAHMGSQTQLLTHMGSYVVCFAIDDHMLYMQRWRKAV